MDDYRFKSKTTEMMENKHDSIYKDKYSNFQKELRSELTELRAEQNNPVKEGYKSVKIAEPSKEEDTNAIEKLVKKLFPKSNKPGIKITDEPMVGKYGGLTTQDVIAPRDLEVDFNTLEMDGYFFRTFFASGYPRFVGPNWLSPIINFEHSLRISTFYYPVDSKEILDKLRKKIGEMEATIYGQMEERKVVDPSVKVALSDAQQLQDSIAEGSERFFHFAMYVTIYATSKDLLEKYSRNVISSMAAMSVNTRSATLQQEPGFISTQPLGLDKLYITRNMDTTSLATTFPFVTSELTMDHGVMYGINMHNKTLVIFDRFELENANAVVFAKSGAGKSYLVKLEAIRSLMLGTDVIIIDPEREYEDLSKAVEGSYISFSQDKGNKMNPFELSGVSEEGEDELRIKLLALQGFFKVMFEGLTSIETSLLDRALILTYREKGINFDPASQKNTPPLLEDLYKVLKGMAEDEAHDLARRMEKYIIGSAAGVFNEATNFQINNPFTVFSVRDLQEELKPLAMYQMLDFIWTVVRKKKKRRLLIVDEAWYMMQREDSARFMYSIAKRARKYYLGLSTITQDVADFLNNDMGKAIISNSSIQILMKQSPSTLEKLQEVFNLSDGERGFLLNCDKGQGLFFAGANHVGIQVLSSVAENELITSDPRELEKRKQESGGEDTRTINQLAAIFDPPATQQAVETTGTRNEEVIQRAVGKRKDDISTIQEERENYQKEYAKMLKEQEERLNPNRKNMNKTYSQIIEEGTIPGRIKKEREELQKGRSHITPQGLIGDNNNEQPKQY